MWVELMHVAESSDASYWSLTCLCLPFSLCLLLTLPSSLTDLCLLPPHVDLCFLPQELSTGCCFLPMQPYSFLSFMFQLKYHFTQLSLSMVTDGASLPQEFFCFFFFFLSLFLLLFPLIKQPLSAYFVESNIKFHEETSGLYHSKCYTYTNGKRVSWHIVGAK